MAAPKTSIVPKPRPRTKTEEKTLRGRPVWIDHTGEVTGEKGAKYSEVTTTIPWGTEWITAPSVDENGKRLSDDEVKQRLLETRGKDFITGEELPTFSNPEKASEYAQWRSDTMFDQEAIEQGFPEEFPMGPEPERKDFIDRSIDKGKDFLEYLTTPSKHGVFNQGGDVSAQMDLMLPKKGMSYGELILDNILGLDNEYESFGEKLGKAINEDEVGFLKDASVGAYEGAKELITSPIQTTKKVFSEIKDGVQRLGSENLNTRLNNMYGVSYADATDDQVNSAKEAVFGDAITALSLVPAAKATVSVAKAGIKNTNIDKVMTLGETEGSTFKGKLNLVHGFNPPTDAPNLVPTFTASEKYGGERYGELDGAETPGGSYGATGVYLENPSDPLFFNSPEMQGFYAPKTAQVSAQFNKAFILRPDTLKELEQITGINLKDSLPKIEDGNLKEKNYLAEEQGALVSAKLKELGYDGLIVKDFFLGDKEIDVYDKYEPLRKKIEVKYKEKFGKPIPEKGTKEHQQIINLYNKQNKELEKIYSQAGIHPLLTQPQIIHLKPETLSTEKVFPESLQSNPSQVSDLQGTQPIQGEKTPGYLERALNKLPEYDPNTLGSMGGNINLTPKAANSPDEPKIISFTKKKEDKELENFNTNLMSSISEQASKQAELVGELQEAGVYGDYQKGVRVQSQNYKGEALPPYTITGLSLNKVKLNNPNLKRVEDRLGIKFEYIEKDGDYYLPMLSVEQADGGKSQVYLDALKQRDTPIMDGPKDFNKGGAVMNEQMEMAFMQQGGLKDDGMNQDPVSGNEVPPGSMAKEVRDDISAFISEGEYVVPADVVRYLGVKHFEDLRDKAKQGLQSMEANGRIGGEPVPVGGPQAAPMMQQPQMAMGGDLSPEEMNEINSIMMAQGGMVPTDPYQQQQMQYTQPMAQGLNVGGTVTQPPAVPEIPQVSPYSSTPSGGFSWENSVSITDTEVPVENEDSCKAKGKVFNSITGMCEEPETPLVETPVVGGDDSDGPTIPPTGTQTEGAFGFGTFGQGVDWTDPEQAIEFINGEYTPIDPATRKAVVGAGMIIGGPAALLSGAATTYDALEDISSLRASVIIAKAFGNTAAEQHAQAKLEDYLAQAPGVASGVFGDWLAPGTGKAENLFKTLGVNLSGNPEEWKNQQEELQKLRDNFKKKKSSTPEPTRSDDDRPTVVPGTPPPSAAGTGGGAKPPRRPTGDDPGPSGAEVAAKASQASTATPASRAKAMSAARQKGGVSASTAAKLSGSQMKAGSGVGSGAGGANYAGPMNKGGLMLKKKKK